VPAPALFPAFVAQHSVVFDPRDEAALAGIELPAALCRAVPKRKLEFAAGRYCASQALRSLAPDSADTPIPIAADRAPLWPPGCIGSITHASGFASAVVARADQAIGIGLDSESLIPPETLAQISSRIVSAEEQRVLVSTSKASEQRLLTIVFSAKESIFKCLYIQIGEYFDFLDVAITSIDLDRGAFTGRLTRELAKPFPIGTTLRGRVVLDGERAHTGTLLLSCDAAGPQFY
jgi:enterobactin synthetase component D